LTEAEAVEGYKCSPWRTLSALSKIFPAVEQMPHNNPLTSTYANAPVPGLTQWILKE